MRKTITIRQSVKLQNCDHRDALTTDNLIWKPACGAVSGFLYRTISLAFEKEEHITVGQTTSFVRSIFNSKSK